MVGGKADSTIHWLLTFIISVKFLLDTETKGSTLTSDFTLPPLSNSDCLKWDEVESSWKTKLEGAIAAPNYSPTYLIYPHTTEALSEVLKIAQENPWAVLPCGSGSKLNWGGPVQNVQLLLSTQRLNRIVEHAVGDLTATVEAGVKLADLQKILQQQGQFLPLNPAYPESATIGGIMATADTGSWRQRYGGVRDLVLGLSFVRADGNIAKAGGRVVKNVAGYDLMKLFTGSYGTLGIISQVTFRVYPLPEASQTVVLSGEEEAIATATQTLRNSSLTPTGAELVSATLVNKLGLGQGIGLVVRFQSIPESVTEQGLQLISIGEKLGLQTSLYQDGDEANLWQKLPELVRVPTSGSGITCKIGIIPTAAVKLLHQLHQMTAERGFASINISSGLGYLQINQEELLDQGKQLRLLCEQNSGFLSVLEASPAFKQKLEPWGYTGNAVEIMRKLKQKFDPANILSPGRYEL